MKTTLCACLGLVSVIINSGIVAGQASAVDPTDIGNWPPCAQRCIPQGFSAPANCGSLSNLDCICKNPDFSLTIGNCEQSTCTLSEKYKIQTLSDILCAPVGGLGPAVRSAVAGYFATYTAGLPSTPVIVAPTPAPALGNVSDLNTYPPCDQQCAYQARAAITSCDTKDKSCICSPDFRSMTAACVEYTCTTEEEKATNDLDDQFCGPLYVNNASLSASVAAAIASATKSANAAISASASAALPGYNTTNGSVTVVAGAPTPSAFTGGAARASDPGLCVTTMMVASFFGALVLGL